ncbi:MAG: hypothetical protein WC608_02100 [Parcubacteria group bacterium]
MVFKKTLNKNRPKGRKGKRKWQGFLKKEAMAEKEAMEITETRQHAGTAGVKSGEGCGFGIITQYIRDATTSVVKISYPDGS